MTKQWDDHRERILELYKKQNRPLNEVMRVMEEQYRFKASVRAYRSRLKRWGVFKYNVGRRNSILTVKTFSSDDSVDGLCSNSPPSPPERRRNLDSPLTAGTDFFGPHIFGISASADEENSSVAPKTEPNTPSSPMPFYERSTRRQMTLPSIDLRKAPEAFTLPPFIVPQRPQHASFVGQNQTEAPVFHWQDMSAFGHHA